jgi:hypothetical protein
VNPPKFEPVHGPAAPCASGAALQISLLDGLEAVTASLRHEQGDDNSAKQGAECEEIVSAERRCRNQNWSGKCHNIVGDLREV